MAKKKAQLNLSTKNVITCAVYAIIGLLLVILQGGSLGLLMTAVGVLLIVLGVMDVMNGELIQGLVEIGIGVIIIVCGWLIADIVLLVFGVLLIIKGVLELAKTYKKDIMAMLPSIVTIVIGVLRVVSKWALMDIICIIAGVIFLINAVLTLFGMKLCK